MKSAKQESSSTNFGFTLVEFLVVISVLALLAALLWPVFIKARTSAKVSVTISNLRQIGQATAMYRTEWNGDGVYGNAYRMGLPCYMEEGVNLPILYTLLPPMNSHPSSSVVGANYWKLFQGEDTLVGREWTLYSQVAQESSVTFIDPYFNDASIRLDDPGFYPLHLIAVRLDTSVLNIERMGDWMLPSFWQDYYESTH